MQVAVEEVAKIKLKQVFKIRARLLKQEVLHAPHEFGASLYRESVEVATQNLNAGRPAASCLVGGVSGRSKRAMATSFLP